MASSKSALFRELALSWMEHLAGEVAFTEDAFADMRRENLDWADAISALETSDSLTAAKENPHDTFFSIVGTTCDGEILRVIVSVDTEVRGICIHHVRRK